MLSSASSTVFRLFPSVLIHFPPSRSGSSGCSPSAFLLTSTLLDPLPSRELSVLAAARSRCCCWRISLSYLLARLRSFRSPLGSFSFTCLRAASAFTVPLNSSSIRWTRGSTCCICRHPRILWAGSVFARRERCLSFVTFKPHYPPVCKLLTWDSLI